jgi:hypothetical protein
MAPDDRTPVAWPQWSRVDDHGLARFVTPQASRWLPLPISRFDVSRQADQYQIIARSIYDTLREQNIRYALEEYHPSQTLQTIRTPAKVLTAPREGTCLDLAALYCGLCLAYELLPILIVTEDHAFAAVSLTHGVRDWNRYRPGRELFAAGPLTDAQALRDLIDEESFLAVECTGFAHSDRLGQKISDRPEAQQRSGGVLTFDQAVQAGRLQLDRTDRPLQFAIDVAVAHYGWRIEPHSLEMPPSAATDKRLRDYLRAMQYVARRHPYSLAIPNAPDLSTVYLRQEATKAQNDQPAGTETVAKSHSLRADLNLLADRPGALVIGGPGAGKSSLLRYLTKIAANGSLEGSESGGFPILIAADALVADRPLPEALAQGVATTVGALLADRELAQMFEYEPMPRTPWLVLLDGVDEVPDPARRRRILDIVAYWCSAPSPYRFLVTSRALPPAELKILEKEALPIYVLEPFTRSQLPEFATRWFEALNIQNSEQLVANFVDQVSHSQLSSLVEIPLIATMMCVVFASRSNQALPRSRLDLYEDFISLLLAKRNTQINALARMQERVRPYGSTAEKAVDELMTGLRSLLEHIAAFRWDSPLQDTESPVDIAYMRLELLRPGHLPGNEWRDILREALRISGLLVEQGEDLQFLHFTIKEFLAACQLSARPTDRELDSLRLINNSSFSRFQVAIWVRDFPELGRAIAERLYNGSIYGLRFFADLVGDGVPLPSDTINLATQRLGALAADTRYEYRIDATEALTALDPQRGFSLWEIFARDPQMYQEALRRLIRISPARAQKVMATIATEPETGQAIREWISYELAQLDRELARDVLVKIAMHEDIPGIGRRWAINSLMGLELSVYVNLLSGIAGKNNTSAFLRRWSAQKLNEIDQERGSDALFTIAADSDIGGLHRRWAAHALSGSNATRALEAFRTIAADPRVDGADRLRAVVEISDHYPEQAVTILTAIATDDRVASEDRLGAATKLVHLDSPNGVEALAALAADRATVGRIRLQAALALESIDESRSIELLAGIAIDPVMAGHERVEAALRLVQTHPQGAASRLAPLALDVGIGVPDRMDLAEALAQLDSKVGASSFASIAADSAIAGTYRLMAALELVGLNEKAGVEALGALASEAGMEAVHKVRAAFELAALVRERGINALAALASDTQTDLGRSDLIVRALRHAQRERRMAFYHGVDVEFIPEATPGRCISYRVQAAYLLSGYDRIRAIDLLEALIDDDDTGVAEQAREVLDSCRSSLSPPGRRVRTSMSGYCGVELAPAGNRWLEQAARHITAELPQYLFHSVVAGRTEAFLAAKRTRVAFVSTSGCSNPAAMRRPLS